jgi:hypothetical protein
MLKFTIIVLKIYVHCCIELTLTYIRLKSLTGYPFSEGNFSTLVGINYLRLTMTGKSRCNVSTCQSTSMLLEIS